MSMKYPWRFAEILSIQAKTHQEKYVKQLGSKGELLIFASIVLVAVFFRTFRLNSLPRGMTADEAAFGLEALAIVQGEDYPVFLQKVFAALPMHAYLMAILFRLLGTSIQTARSASALAGIISVPILYFLVTELFPSTEKQRSWWVIALLSTYSLATSYWHVVYSRIAIEPILVPLFAILVLYWLLRARNSGRRVFFIVTGLFLGLAFYTYPAANFLLVLVSVLLGYYTWQDREFLRAHWINMLLLFAACLAAAAPLALFALTHPNVFAARLNELSLLNPVAAGGSPVRAFITSIARTVAMFAIKGDTKALHNPAGRPVLDALASVWFVLGLWVIMRRYREPPYFLLLTWLIIMCLPGALTAENIPHFGRTIGALPVTCILPAIGMLSAWQWFAARLRPSRLLSVFAALLLSLSFLVTTIGTYHDYFVVWDTRQDLQQGYDGAYSAAAEIMNQTHVPDSVWILPHTSLTPSGFGGDHLDFLYRGDTPYHSVSLHEATAPRELSRICRGKQKALVVEWKGYVLEEAYNAMAGDPKGLIPFLLGKYGRELNRRSYAGLDLVTYQLPESPAFSIAKRFEPLTVNFGNELMLVGMAFGGSSLHDISNPREVQRRELPSGKSGWVALHWRALTRPIRNYKVSVHLLDQEGHLAGQVDKLLLSNDLHPTIDWRAGQEGIDYYTLPSWGGIAPGWYTIGVTLYDAETLEPVGVGARGQAYELGTMEIVRPLEPGMVEPEVRIESGKGEAAPGIRLLGYDLPRRELNPGDKLSVALYWQAVEDVSRNYLLAVRMTGEQGEEWGEEFEPPVYGTYPTTQWVEGEILKDWHDVSLPTDMPQGSYWVSLFVLEDDGLSKRVDLDKIEVRGRPRQFTMPEIQHPMEATLGQQIRFLGYNLSSNEMKPGETLQLTLYWQALGEMEVSYTVFTHVLDAEDRIWGQRDSIPSRGEAPTTSWIEGEVIVDEYEIMVEPGAPPGEYVIEIGMYDAATGQRLPVVSDNQILEQDRVLLGVVQVAPSN